ncbi:FHA domain protein [Cordyceps fumosorosea ARSEF 2679]|uniref:FHA domain protein n=1 Tax=Cordyceps fumosorosea (strain ARSEF 2679) TaxID=1081104 RepID=A0A167QKE4_CORFA|nr:FHA domain protein [Cordyceps fumosorosea ARSEF 2679]OAA57721.1 FHA domain protein [Cordyceps fumosorosea ARSEF 2679]
MPETLAEGEVLVTLSCIDPPPNLMYPRRRLLLSNKRNTARIGRASKRTSGLESRMYNGYINSPVISREHAELKFDSQSKTVFIRDIGSLHGTFHNDTKLQKDQFQAVRDGDSLKFGIYIDRGDQVFPQCATNVSLQFGQIAQHGAAEPSLPQPLVFQVPDESDSEDMDDLEDTDTDEVNSIDNDNYENDSVLRSGAAILAGNGLELEFRGFDASDAIDLTSEPDLVSEGNILSGSSISEDTDLPVHDADHTLGRIEPRDKMELRTLNARPVPPLRSAGFPRTAHDIFSLDGDVPGFYGPLSEDQHLDATSEIVPGTFDEKTWRELLTSGAEGMIYKDRVQTTLPPDNACVQTTSPPGDARVQTTSPPGDACVQTTSPPGDADVQDKAHTQSDQQEGLAPSNSPSRKRKAEQISDLSPVEAAESGTSNAVQSQDSQPRDMASNVDTTPPYKRIRTAAEYVGLMAIGGMAVMTALIATAPNF